MMIHSVLFFCPVFNPPHRNTVWIGVVVCRLGSKCPLLWLANSSVCLAVYVLHRWTLLWFRLNMHKYLSNYLFNRQNNSDHVKQPYSQLCVATLLNLLIKCSEQGRGLTHTVYRYSLIPVDKVHPLFPNVGIRRKALHSVLSSEHLYCLVSL